jgi:hypothetical protein
MRAYSITTSLIFFVVAVVHLLRLIGQWNVVIGGWSFPTWASIFAALVAGFLSFAGFRLFQTQRMSLLR